MIKIGVLSQKGGVSKSTIARLLAVEYARAEYKTLILDLDTAQATCSEWMVARDKQGIEPKVDVRIVQDKQIKQAFTRAAQNSYECLVIDGKPFSNKHTLTVAQLVDLIIIPSSTSNDDLRPTINLCHELKRAKVPKSKFAVLLSKVGTSESELSECKKEIQGTGYKLFENVLYEKTAIRRALDIGKVGTETSYKSINQMCDNVVGEIGAYIENLKL